MLEDILLNHDDVVIDVLDSGDDANPPLVDPIVGDDTADPFGGAHPSPGDSVVDLTVQDDTSLGVDPSLVTGGDGLALDGEGGGDADGNTASADGGALIDVVLDPGLAYDASLASLESGLVWDQALPAEQLAAEVLPATDPGFGADLEGDAIYTIMPVWDEIVLVSDDDTSGGDGADDPGGSVDAGAGDGSDGSNDGSTDDASGGAGVVDDGSWGDAYDVPPDDGTLDPALLPLISLVPATDYIL